MDNTKYTFSDFTEEEAKIVNSDLKAFLEKHNAELITSPFITSSGNISVRSGLMKKVELVPKDTPPIIEPEIVKE